MALVAFFTKTLFVRIIFVMAVIACRRRVTMFAVFFMASGASQPLVRAFQGEIGLLMIEGIRIEMDDVGIAAYMFGVANLASQLLDVFDAAVESPFVIDIRLDLLMAVEA